MSETDTPVRIEEPLEPIFLSEPFDIEVQDPDNVCHLLVGERMTSLCGRTVSSRNGLAANEARARQILCDGAIGCGRRRCVACAELFLSRK